MSADSALVRAARAFQRVPLGPLRRLEAPLLGPVGSEPMHGPLILLALPRSGSTLASQVLVHALAPHYLGNLGSALHELPAVGLRLSRLGWRRRRGDFESVAGRTRGLSGANEGLRFWTRWFGAGLVDAAAGEMGEAESEASAHLARVLATLSTAERPLLTAYLGHALVVDRLRARFPAAVFLRLHRDRLATAASLLRLHRERGGWVSVRPRECAGIADDDPVGAAAAQVYWLTRRLDADVCAERTLHLGYERLCADPRGETERVVAFGARRGLRLRRRRPLPERFTPATRVDAADARALAAAFDALQAEHGALAPVPPEARP